MAKSMEYVDKMEQAIIDALGAERALDAITRALDYDTKADIYSYIIRCHDIQGVEDEDNSNS